MMDVLPVWREPETGPGDTAPMRPATRALLLSLALRVKMSAGVPHGDTVRFEADASNPQM